MQPVTSRLSTPATSDFTKLIPSNRNYLLFYRQYIFFPNCQNSGPFRMGRSKTRYRPNTREVHIQMSHKSYATIFLDQYVAEFHDVF